MFYLELAMRKLNYDYFVWVNADTRFECALLLWSLCEKEEDSLQGAGEELDAPYERRTRRGWRKGLRFLGE